MRVSFVLIQLFGCNMKYTNCIFVTAGVCSEKCWLLWSSRCWL